MAEPDSTSSGQEEAVEADRKEEAVAKNVNDEQEVKATQQELVEVDTKEGVVAEKEDAAQEGTDKVDISTSEKGAAGQQEVEAEGRDTQEAVAEEDVGAQGECSTPPQNLVAGTDGEAQEPEAEGNSSQDSPGGQAVSEASAAPSKATEEKTQEEDSVVKDEVTKSAMPDGDAVVNNTEQKEEQTNATEGDEGESRKPEAS